MHVRVCVWSIVFSSFFSVDANVSIRIALFRISFAEYDDAHLSMVVVN